MPTFSQKEAKVLYIDIWLTSYLNVALGQGIYTFVLWKIDCCYHVLGIEVDGEFCLFLDMKVALNFFNITK